MQNIGLEPVITQDVVPIQTTDAGPGNGGFKERLKSIFKHLPLIIALLACIAFALLFINVFNKNEAQKITTDNKTRDYEEQKSLYEAQKTIVDNKSNCTVCPEVAPATPAATTTTPSTSKKTTTSSTQEEVIAPPAPPSD